MLQEMLYMHQVIDRFHQEVYEAVKEALAENIELIQAGIPYKSTPVNATLEGLVILIQGEEEKVNLSFNKVGPTNLWNTTICLDKYGEIPVRDRKEGENGLLYPEEITLVYGTKPMLTTNIYI